MKILGFEPKEAYLQLAMAMCQPGHASDVAALGVGSMDDRFRNRTLALHLLGESAGEVKAVAVLGQHFDSGTGERLLVMAVVDFERAIDQAECSPFEFLGDNHSGRMLVTSEANT